MNTHETYVSLETAKLLKEAGFDWLINSAYKDGVLVYQEYSLCDDFNGKHYENDTRYEFFSAPTLAVSQRWLREIKKYEIVVEFDFDSPFGEKCYYAEYVDTRTNGEKRYYNNIVEDEYFKAYEGALEFGIKKCLELIIEETKQEQQ